MMRMTMKIRIKVELVLIFILISVLQIILQTLAPNLYKDETGMQDEERMRNEKG